MAITYIQVTGTFKDDSGNAAKGSVLFSLTSPVKDVTDKTIVPTSYVTATLDPDGKIAVALVATDDPGLAPQGVLYRVDEHVGLRRTYYITVPVAAPAGTIDLAELVPVTRQEPYWQLAQQYQLAAETAARQSADSALQATLDTLLTPQTLPGAATDAASTQDLVNAIRALLITAGLAQ